MNPKVEAFNAEDVLLQEVKNEEEMNQGRI